MDIIDEELIKFWKLLNQNKVAYIMIGGFAVNLHGFSRTTGDLDIWLKDDTNNRKKLERVLEKFGYDKSSN